MKVWPQWNQSHFDFADLVDTSSLSLLIRWLLTPSSARRSPPPSSVCSASYSKERHLQSWTYMLLKSSNSYSIWNKSGQGSAWMSNAPPLHPLRGQCWGVTVQEGLADLLTWVKQTTMTYCDIKAKSHQGNNFGLFYHFFKSLWFNIASLCRLSDSLSTIRSINDVVITVQDIIVAWAYCEGMGGWVVALVSVAVFRHTLIT